VHKKKPTENIEMTEAIPLRKKICNCFKKKKEQT